ncbi:MAG: NADH-quinone oxidoreductase subunit C [Gammaproteobacteria bacterium]|nr:NADH-quinone oxidoreductase subunit C [Gammaproteobacteria bacterium]NIR81597.1 NADH-quinone oxidoreductase subunit C [Gammaproteobacteria bacterium]NIU02710.1 NADH-quinone oxidoreductase subunit C [Gammaproteobacteria bacterium]NIV50287.1 NADH-quinone oxidoreductase subunit C [Gammaproteobacteria bacterium]NIW85017.1 NADH-quinone oxidoreductase subunit C [Gammaproteobacteria bacterium]
MTAAVQRLASSLRERFSQAAVSVGVDRDEITMELPRRGMLSVFRALRDEPDFAFEQLMDVCGLDYLSYGQDEWSTEEASTTGFSRAARRESATVSACGARRFAVVYHLLSLSRNHRLRARIYCEDDDLPIVDSVNELWPSADWFEREAFDLFGILFEGHPDLRRILTDYGFVGHPFRKDFPLIGNVEVRYDPERQRVVYQPVSIEPRTLVPRVIRREEQEDMQAVRREEGAPDA